MFQNGADRTGILQNHWQDPQSSQGAPLRAFGAMVLQEDQGQEALRLGSRPGRQAQAKSQHVRQERAADQTGARHVQRWAHVQDARVHDEVQLQL